MRLNRDAKCFFPVESKDCMKSASYEYRKMSARSGAQFVPIGMPTVCWKTFPAKTTKNIVNKKLKHLGDVVFRVLVFRIRVLLHKNMFLHALIPNICIYGYRFWKWRRFGWYGWVFLSISGEVWLYKEWKNQKTRCLLHDWKLEI